MWLLTTLTMTTTITLQMKLYHIFRPPEREREREGGEGEREGTTTLQTPLVQSAWINESLFHGTGKNYSEEWHHWPPLERPPQGHVTTLVREELRPRPSMEYVCVCVSHSHGCSFTHTLSLSLTQAPFVSIFAQTFAGILIYCTYFQPVITCYMISVRGRGRVWATLRWIRKPSRLWSNISGFIWIITSLILGSLPPPQLYHTCLLPHVALIIRQ